MGKVFSCLRLLVEFYVCKLQITRLFKIKIKISNCSDSEGHCAWARPLEKSTLYHLTEVCFLLIISSCDGKSKLSHLPCYNDKLNMCFIDSYMLLHNGIQDQQGPESAASALR